MSDQTSIAQENHRMSQEIIELRDILKSKDDALDDLNRDLEHVTQDKQDYEQLSQELSNKIQKMKHGETTLQDELQAKENMLQSNYDKLNNYEYTNGELQKQLKKTELKLRQIQTTKLKDAQRSIKQKDQEIAELQKKLQLVINDRGSLDRGARRGLNQSKSTKNNLPDYGRLSSGIKPTLNNNMARNSSAVVNEVEE